MGEGPASGIALTTPTRHGLTGQERGAAVSPQSATNPVESSSGAWAPPIPWRGVRDALALFSGRGQLFASLAHVTDPASDQWTPRQVEQRANRVIFERVLDSLRHMPDRSATWEDALPATSRKFRTVEMAPGGRVDWSRTRGFGWPPTQFHVHRRLRQSDTLLAETLRWCAVTLERIHTDAASLAPGIDAGVESQIAALRRFASTWHSEEASATPPDRQVLAAVSSAGRPWSALARLARDLLHGADNLEVLARDLIYPDDDLRWRLFHLACLGLALAELRVDCQVVSMRPLGVGVGPAFKVVDGGGRSWDLWFEAAGMWNHYGVRAPYVLATGGLSGAGGPLGADLALVSPGHAALLVECKYSDDPTYVGRSGYHQAVTYLTESRSGLVPVADAAVIGPERVVARPASTLLMTGSVTIGPPSALAVAVRTILDL